MQRAWKFLSDENRVNGPVITKRWTKAYAKRYVAKKYGVIKPYEKPKMIDDLSIGWKNAQQKGKLKKSEVN